MHQIQPVPSKFLIAWEIALAHHESQQALEKAPWYSRIKSKVNVATLYTLKQEMEKVILRGTDLDIIRMRAGLYRGIESLVIKNQVSDAEKILGSLRSRFNDEATGLTESTIQQLVDAQKEKAQNVNNAVRFIVAPPKLDTQMSDKKNYYHDLVRQYGRISAGAIETKVAFHTEVSDKDFACIALSMMGAGRLPQLAPLVALHASVTGVSVEQVAERVLSSAELVLNDPAHHYMGSYQLNDLMFGEGHGRSYVGGEVLLALADHHLKNAVQSLSRPDRPAPTLGISS